jgi:hypothetical protein
MNILYIIGNGFDINLGLKTRYSDFYEYYKHIKSTNDLINDLKDEISKDILNWSDLELAFGRYMKNLNSIEEFDQVFEDIVNSLGDYLSNEESTLDKNAIDIVRFLTQLYNPERSLAQGEIEEIMKFKNEEFAGQWNIDIITLNYTRTIENILVDHPFGSVITTLRNGNSVLLNSIKHIHGYTNERMILGVNDISQIGQISFHTNQEIIEALVKRDCNRSQKHNIDRQCENHVSNADLICIFGSSIGETDNFWWNLIGEQLRRNTKLIIFSKGEDINLRLAHKPARSQRAIKKVFLDRTDLNEDEKLEYSKNIYVSVNGDMFSIKK